MNPSEDNKPQKTEKEILAEEFLKAVESTIKKAEKETWLIHDPDHPYENKTQK